MECAQLQITEGGKTSPATVSFPGAYHGKPKSYLGMVDKRHLLAISLGSDPGITINIYTSLSGYTIPGPPVFSCSGGGGSTAVPPSSTVISSTIAAPPVTTPATGAGNVAQYGQCGGIG